MDTANAESSFIYIFTGDGKGKTVAAVGQAVRAVGHGWKVLIVQFIKEELSGEVEPLEKLGVEIYAKGLGFVRRFANAQQPSSLARMGMKGDKKSFDEHRQAAEDGLEFAREKVKNGAYQLLILDEINIAVSLGLLKEGEVLRFLRERPKGLNVVLTGRKAPESFIDAADLVTEMKEVKHPLAQGQSAEPGLEY